MRKITSLLLIMFFVSSLCAVSYQRTYLKDSIEWKAAEALLISEGYNPPTSVNPATGAEIISSLSLLEPESMGEVERSFLDYAVQSLSWEPVIESGNFAMTPSVIISPEVYKHTTAFDSYSDYLFPVRDRLSALDFDIDLEYADTFYGFVDYLVLSPEHEKQYDKLWGTNIDAIKGGFNTQHEGTLRAGGLFGNEWMNFSVQRSRQSLGYGKSGTFTLGDNFSRQDFMRFHTFSDIFDYTLNLTLFSNMDSNMETIDFNFNGMHNILSLHRFDIKLFDRAMISITEGIAAYMDSTLDIRLLNPFLFHHGFNNYNEGIEAKPLDGDEANNIFSVELGYTVLPHMRVRGELIFDQIQLSGEAAAQNARPNANGFMVGLDSSWILSEDMFITVYAEFAKTSPYLYLNYKENSGKLQPNYDYIFGVHDWWGVDEVAYGGYRFGPDAVVLGFGASIGGIGSFLVDADFVYSRHGLYGLGYDKGVRNEFGPDHINDKSPTGEEDQIERRIEAKIDSEILITDYLSLKAGVGYVYAQNYRNNPGMTFSDLQMKLGVSLDVTGIFR